jgi:hypothetical protein
MRKHAGPVKPKDRMLTHGGSESKSPLKNLDISADYPKRESLDVPWQFV